jgi:hypothetical protein
MLQHVRGALVEYTAAPPLTLVFDLNPQTITRTRQVEVRDDNPPGSRGVAFTSPADVARVAQGTTVKPESFSVQILLDATDALHRGDAIAGRFGIEPELAVLREMVEPKVQGLLGVRTLARLGVGGQRAFARTESASVLLFAWGEQILPVFLTAVQIEEQAHLPSLQPYRATAELTMQVIEGANPFHLAMRARQVGLASVGAALQATRLPEVLR